MRHIVLLVTLITLSSCINIRDNLATNALPSVGYRYLDPIAEETFDTVGQWRTYDGGDDLYMSVADGVYTIDLSLKQAVWTQAPIQHDDAIIEVTTQQKSEYNYNAYGVACRLAPDNSGRGYYFLISGDGHYSIRWNNGRTLDDIVAMTPHETILQGQATNRIRAVCIDDYLGLWINGEFVAEARDNRATQGYIGLAGFMGYNNQNLTVAFDNLKAWNSTFSD